MGLGNLLVLAQVTAYLVAFLLSFFVFVPLTVQLAQFNGHCLLYATGRWNATESKLVDIHWGDGGLCNYPIFTGVLIMPLSLFYILWMSIYLYKNSEPSWLATFASLVTSAVGTLFVLLSSILVTVGFDQWCDLLTINPSGPRYEYCDIGDYTQDFIGEKDVNPGEYYVLFGMAKFGLWSSLVVWVLLLAFSAARLYQYHKQEDFFTSMLRERQRLIQRVQTPQYA